MKYAAWGCMALMEFNPAAALFAQSLPSLTEERVRLAARNLQTEHAMVVSILAGRCVVYCEELALGGPEAKPIGIRRSFVSDWESRTKADEEAARLNAEGGRCRYLVR